MYEYDAQVYIQKACFHFSVLVFRRRWKKRISLAACVQAGMGVLLRCRWMFPVSGGCAGSVAQVQMDVSC